MAKFIDVSKIEGYEAMTDAEKVEALTAYELPEASTDGYIKKSLFDKTASELSATKKALREKMTVDEARSAEIAELQAQKQAEIDEIKAKLESVERENAKIKHVSGYVGIGFSKDVADAIVDAHLTGDIVAVIEHTRKHIDALKASIKAEMMNADPKPDGTAGASGNPYSPGKEAAKRAACGSSELENALKYYS